MKQITFFLLIIFLINICYSQSILETKTGMIYTGKFVEIDSTYITFFPEGGSNQQKLPRKIVERVIFSDGKIFFENNRINKEKKFVSYEEYQILISESVNRESKKNIETEADSFLKKPAEKVQSLDSLNAIIIYRYAYKTAMCDNKIHPDEKAILKSLEQMLDLSQENILSVQNQILLTSLKVLDQSGRWPLVLQNIGWGAGLYGWAIPYVLDVKDYKWIIGTEMMSFAGSFLLTYKYTKEMEIPHSRAQMMRFGSAIGFRYGWGINTFFDFWNDSDYDEYGEKDEKRIWAVILMASVPAGIYAGDYLFNKWEPSHGQSWSLTLWSELGAYTIRHLHHIIDNKPNEPERYDYSTWEESAEHKQWEKDHTKWKKRHTLFDLAAYPLGIYVGKRFFGERQYTFGDALMLYQGRGFGWLYGLMLADIFDIKYESTSGRLARVGGSIGGTLLLDRFIAGYDYTFGQSFLMFLGTISGMTFSMGVSAILEIDEIAAFDALVMGGGATGFFLTNSILSLQKERVNFLNSEVLKISVSPTFFICDKYSKNPFKSVIPG
ncbi:hypothetical protein KAU33_11060, partial [Candidatus Dependentiae bacterium]|nr:hypothetical protein [Candidatus Dependentiae bacterium]